MKAAPVAPMVVPPPMPRAKLPTVASLIQALLDTTRAGRRSAADSLRGLRAGVAVRAFYGPVAAAAWAPAPPADSLGDNAQAVLALLGRAYDYGLRPGDYDLDRLLSLRDSLDRPAPAKARLQQLARLDVYLTDAVLAFGHDLGRGRLSPPATAAAGRQLRTALAAGQVPQLLLAAQPANREYRQLQQALAQWLRRAGPPDSAVARQPLRFERLAINLERWRQQPIVEPEYLLVNIPAFELQVVAHDTVKRRFRVIVGKPLTPTPTLSSRIRYFTLAPAWNVPYSIASQEMLPRLKDDPGFLNDNNLELYDGRHRRRNPWRIDWSQVTEQTFAYTIRQSAGGGNALGNVVFHFPNPNLVYLHDTPERYLFARPIRALSHGCIRLEHPRELATYLLQREGSPAVLPTAAEARQHPPQDVLLRQPLPIYIRYATATAENGRLRFLTDVYGHDQTLHEALYCP
jgi:murein L,D-transpeptidase YcbB/YkuD